MTMADPAQQIAKAVQGCTQVLTTQHQQCRTIQFHECTAESVAVIYANGAAESLVWSSRNGDLTESVFLARPGGTHAKEVTHHFSYDDLRRTGQSEYRAIGSLSMGGLTWDDLNIGFVTTLSRETEVIGGMTFRIGESVTAIELPRNMGSLITKSKIFVADDLDEMIPGETFTHLAGRKSGPTYQLKQVIRPGRPGFLSTKGQYDCGEAS
ncbi:MAG TPA: hypothetical protein ENK83_05400 [Aliiroseovarius sp.]|nr:hypothetical protein [Aliiroseovarius sp.]